MTETKLEQLIREVDARAAVIVRELPPEPLSPRTCVEITGRVLPIMNAEDDPELDAIDNKRRRYVRMLWAIAKIDDDNLLPQVGTYIGGLAVALEDLIEGVTPDPLFVTKGSGAKRDSKCRWGGRLQVAIGVEFLVLGNLKRPQIKEIVRRHYSQLDQLMRCSRRDVGGAVLFWYDCFLEGTVPVEPLLEEFRKTRRELKAAKLSAPEYREGGKKVLKFAVKAASR
jgi:hypothetical protein